MRIKSALVVMDKTKHRQTALKRALEIQRGCGAHLRLVAFCWNAMSEQSEVFDVHQRKEMKKEILRARREWLAERVRDAGCGDRDVSTETRWTDDIAGWIEKNAGEQDLVIKSINRSRTLTHTPLDWQLLRRSPVPVLIASQRKRKTSGNILATLDLRHTDRKHRTLNFRVLDAALALAEIYGGTVHCVNVVEISKVLEDLDLIDPRKIQARAIANNKDLLAALLEPYEIPPARVHQPVGKVGQMVSATARKINADLLVVGSSARRGAGAALIGNSAERILTRSPCDVLAVHP